MIEEVAEATYRLSVGMEGARDPYSAYLLTEDETVLIEPGPEAMVPSILDGMKRLGLKRLSYVIPTHIHMDHGGGAGKMARLFPKARVVVHPRGVRHAVDPSRLIAATKLAYSDNFEHIYGSILPIPESQVQVAADGDTIRAGGRKLSIIHTPGHAAHHMAIFDGKTHGLFCGEALGVPIPGTETSALPSVSVGDLDVDLYLASIEKLKKLRPRVLFYSHDGGVRAPDDIFSRVAETTVMLRDVILEGLRSGDTIEQIERRIRERLSGPVGAKAEAMGMAQTITAYAAYFRKKGMVQDATNGT